MKPSIIGNFDENFDNWYYDLRLKEIKALDSIILTLSTEDSYNSKRCLSVSNRRNTVTIAFLNDFKGATK